MMGVVLGGNDLRLKVLSFLDDKLNRSYSEKEAQDPLLWDVFVHTPSCMAWQLLLRKGLGQR